MIYITKYEKLIYDLINNLHEHLTVNQIFEELKKDNSKIVLATVYNNLNRLIEAGLIRKISTEGTADRYDRVHKHDHIICKECGKILDINFNDLTESLKTHIGGDFLYYDLRVYYVCQSCRGKVK